MHELILRRLLREAEDMGDIVFSPNRIDAPRFEPNTKFEDRLFDDIDKWLVHIEASADLGDRIKKLMRHPKHGEFFVAPPRESVIYRGMGLDAVELGEIVGLDEAEIIAGSKPGKLRGSFDVELLGPVASWTHSIKTANYFADKWAMEIDGYSVVFSARAKDNVGTLFDLDKAVQRIDSWKAFVEEREVLACDTVSAFEVMWW